MKMLPDFAPQRRFGVAQFYWGNWFRSAMCGAIALKVLFWDGSGFWVCRFLDLSLRAEIRIPAPEDVLPLLVRILQEKMCSTLTPPRLLSLHYPVFLDPPVKVGDTEKRKFPRPFVEVSGGYDHKDG